LASGPVWHCDYQGLIPHGLQLIFNNNEDVDKDELQATWDECQIASVFPI